MTEFNTLYLQEQLARFRQGDTAARDELIRPAMHRLELLARKMLKSYPTVARWEDTFDVLQQAVMRLVRALETVDVATTRDFFSLAATQIRRQLIDLARHYHGPQGMGRHHDSVAGDTGLVQKCGSGGAEAGPPAGEDLDRWIAFHEAVEELPVKEREAFTLSFYQGWTHVQIAELLDIDEKTSRRWYHNALFLLTQKFGDCKMA